MDETATAQAYTRTKDTEAAQKKTENAQILSKTLSVASKEIRSDLAATGAWVKVTAARIRSSGGRTRGAMPLRTAGREDTDFALHSVRNATKGSTLDAFWAGK